MNPDELAQFFLGPQAQAPLSPPGMDLSPPQLEPQDPYAQPMPEDPYAVSTPKPLGPQTQAGQGPAEGLPGIPRQAPPAPPSKARLMAEETLMRNKALVDNPAGFGAAGGVASSRSDVARMAGGVGQTEMEAAELDIQGKRTAAQRQAMSDLAKANLLAEHSNEWAQRSEKINLDSQQRLTAWQKRADEQSKRMVDPQAGWNNRSGFSKAMFALSMMFASQTRDASRNMQLVNQQIDSIIQADIQAQRANIEIGQQGVKDAYAGMEAQNKLDLKTLDDWTLAEKTRLDSLGRALDARIAMMGNQAADAAGLLKAKAAIDSKQLVVQEKLQQQIETDRLQKQSQAHAVYMARLKRGWEQEDAALEFERKKELKGIEDRGDAIPTGTGLGLNLVDKTTGQKVTGQLRLAPGVKGKPAVEAKQILSNANAEATMLQEVKKEWDKMSTTDILRGGSPEFQQKVLTYMVPKLKLTSGAAVTKEEYNRFVKSEFGFDIVAGGGLFGAAADFTKAPGDVKEGVKRAIDNNLRSLASKTTNELQPYLSADDAQRFEIVYQPQNTTVPEKGAESQNEAIRRAGGGAPVADLQTFDRRGPLDEKQGAAKEGNAAAAVQYLMQRESGQLPLLDPNDQNKVDAARADFQNRSTETVQKFANAYKRDKSLSAEAKFQIAMEAFLASQEARRKEDLIVEDAETKSRQARGVDTLTGPMGLPDIGFSVEKFRKSEAYKEARRRAGLID